MGYWDDQLAAGKNVFIPLEALGEHIGSCWYALQQIGRDTGTLTATGRGRFPIGTPEYHLQAIEQYQEQIFQLLAAMLPDLYHASDEGSTPPEVIARIRASQRDTL